MSSFDASQFVDREQTFSIFADKLLDPRSKFAVMRIESPAQMGKTWLLTKMEQHCIDNAIPVARINFGNPLDSAPDAIGLMRMVADRFRRPTFFEDLQTAITLLSSVELRTPLSVLQRLADKIVTYYVEVGELTRLAAFHDVLYADLRGETISEKAAALVLRLYQRGIESLQQLIATIKQERPKVRVDWDSYLADLQAALDEPQAQIFRARSDMEAAAVERQIGRVFFDCLRRLINDSGSEQAVILIDAYEKAPYELKKWFKEQLLIQLTDPVLTKLLIVAAGKEGVTDFSNEAIASLIAVAPPDFKRTLYDLPELELEHFIQYMEQIRQIVESPPDVVWRPMYTAIGGVPGEMKKVADRLLRRETQRDSKSDPFFN